MKTKLELFLKTFLKTLMPFAIGLVVLLIAFLGARVMVSFTIWQSNDPVYRGLKLIETICITAFPFLIAFIIIFVGMRCLYKTYDYMDIMYSAMERILTNNDEDEMVKLPEELSELEVKINQVIITARENKRQAIESEKKKNDLVVYLAHDLKTPLTSVIGYLTLLNDEQQISPELREKYLSISLDKAERLEELINEFFEITRFNLTNLTIEHKKINLSRMMEQIQYEFLPMFQEKNITSKLNTPKDLMIKCDPDKMQRVFDNLLRNAVNYSYENSEINIDIIPEKDKVYIRVCNHGDTIPKEKLDRIFEQFYRLDTARTSKSGGAGLGLAIAKQIVELHGGSITAKSEDDIIEFQVEIPGLLENREN